ncbi:acetylglutamate kinase [Thalassotalea agariperforans]
MKPLVIKIGGAILEKASALKALLVEIAKLENQQVVLVHGGGSSVDAQLSQAGFTTEKKDGKRITPAEQMPIIAGTLAGFVNKTIVGQANELKLAAVGLSLGDGNMVSCTLADPALGNVGDPAPKESALLTTLLSNGFFPVVSSIGALDNGELVNVNADDAAVAICQLLEAELLLLTDVPGVKGADGEWLVELGSQQAAELIEQGVIAGGMTAKVNAALLAANQLRRSIAVASWQSPELIVNLLKGDNIGTRILADS